jgi:glycosyltransferase involved in cell wall biosynthesis
MRILVVASFPESLVKFRGNLLMSLIQRGANVHVAAPALSADVETSNRLVAMGCLCHDIDMMRNGMNPLVDLRTIFSLFWLMRRVKPTHLLAYTIKPVIYATLVAWITGTPRRLALITGLGYGFTGNHTGLRRIFQRIPEMLYRISLKRATRVIFQNPDDRNFFVNAELVDAPRSMLVNGSGVPLDVFVQRPLPPLTECHFVLVSRLLRDKGIHEYVAAARKVKSRYPHAVFNLVGWIDSNPSAIRQADLDSWRNEGVIEFHGRIEDVREILAASHVFVLPSYREGTPRSVLEAMATGRAIITSDAPGCRETVIPGLNGYLVPVSDVNGLAIAMEKFLLDSNLALEMGRQSRVIAETKYDVNVVNASMRRYLDVE